MPRSGQKREWVQQQHDDQQKHQQSAGGSVAPLARMRPMRHGADEDQHQDDQEDCGEHDKYNVGMTFRASVPRPGLCPATSCRV